MKSFDTIDAKYRAKAILSLNIGDLNDKYGFKKPFMRGRHFNCVKLRQ